MRHSEKSEGSHYNNHDIFGVNSRELTKDQHSNLYELAGEYGMNAKEAKKLKKRVNRS
ncbi:hypothetical protein SLL00_09140 [Metabacillus indicus]|jgi:hypothetical protein|uniref:hypothetical protein n=1 Tax=Metabacillus indicus TaxID=246786 RepID=UPI0024930A09|nr:hypothetical protein [Metabacillus indicus]MDX8289958.1 hypothetical protein [Metabacillus indicus]